MSLPLAPGLHPPLLLPEHDELRLTENCSNGNAGFKPCTSMGTISECLQDTLYSYARTNCMMINLKNMSNAGRALGNSFPWSSQCCLDEDAAFSPRTVPYSHITKCEWQGRVKQLLHPPKFYSSFKYPMCYLFRTSYSAGETKPSSYYKIVLHWGHMREWECNSDLLRFDMMFCVVWITSMPKSYTRDHHPLGHHLTLRRIFCSNTQKSLVFSLCKSAYLSGMAGL